METMDKTGAICVLTARGIEKILADGGSQAWVLDANRARSYKYVICVQNCGFTDDWGNTSAPHHTAFLVGRLQDVVRSDEDGCENRWLLQFSEYAEINIADAWPGYRNPVYYTELEQFGITLESLTFHPMPKQDPITNKVTPLTINEAKQGLALALGVSTSNIDITIRG